MPLVFLPYPFIKWGRRLYHRLGKPSIAFADYKTVTNEGV